MSDSNLVQQNVRSIMINHTVMHSGERDDCGATLTLHPHWVSGTKGLRLDSCRGRLYLPRVDISSECHHKHVPSTF